MDPTTIFGALGPNTGAPVQAPAGMPLNLSGAAPTTQGQAQTQPNYSGLLQLAQKLMAHPQNPGMTPMQMPIGILNRSY